VLGADVSWYVSSKPSWTGLFYHYVWLAFPSVEGLGKSNAIGANVKTVLSARLWLQRNNRRLESRFEWNSRCWNRVVMIRYKQRSVICSGSIGYDWCSYSFDNSILSLKRGKSRYTASYFTFREFILAGFLYRSEEVSVDRSVAV